MNLTNVIKTYQKCINQIKTKHISANLIKLFKQTFFVYIVVLLCVLKGKSTCIILHFVQECLYYPPIWCTISAQRKTCSMKIVSLSFWGPESVSNSRITSLQTDTSRPTVCMWEMGTEGEFARARLSVFLPCALSAQCQCLLVIE